MLMFKKYQYYIRIVSSKIIHLLFASYKNEIMAYKIKLICTKVIPVLIFLQFFQLAIAQNNWKQLDSMLDKNRSALGNNAVCLIWKNDSLIYQKETGNYSDNTVAPIASCSKWLTAALVMQFVDEGKLSLDDKVSAYLPAFEKNGKEEITIRNTLCHMTGIEADKAGSLRSILNRRKFKNLGEEVNSFTAHKQIAAPGTEFRYNGVGLNIAGHIIEKITGKKFEDVIKEKLFLPLGMTQTTFAEEKAVPVNPSGGAKSTANDYSKFLMMLLNKGVFNDKRILSENSIELMRTAQDSPEQIKYAPKAGEGKTYALGSWIMDDKNRKLEDSKGEIATVLSSPGLFGTWPMIDYCRGYAYIFFVKNFLGDQRASIHLEIKKMIDKQIPQGCN